MMDGACHLHIDLSTRDKVTGRLPEGFILYHDSKCHSAFIDVRSYKV